ncbi:MAG: proline dehydrogenase family protein [Chitinophagales bacterium]|nr:proline dehydrogenase family protein [Chitinophagales bacterium]
MKSIFEQTQIAFQGRSDEEIKKSYWIYWLFNQTTLVNLANKILLFFFQIRFPLVSSIVRNTIFPQFCGGENLEEIASKLKSLAKEDLEILLNYSVEGLEDEKSYRATFDELNRALALGKNYPNLRAICLKLTSFVSIDILTKIQANEPLSSKESQIFEQAKTYVDTLIQTSIQNKVHVYIDAEESWFQDIIDEVTYELMRRYNKGNAVVFNTFQLYRQDTLANLKNTHQILKAEGVLLGAKIVRGAYVEKEAAYAEKNQRPNPIHTSKANTDKDFDLALRYVLDHLDTISVCIASHNEASNQLLLEILEEKSIAKNHPHLCISQLLGMSDHISYTLKNEGLTCAKYVPYGPVHEVMPYLIRRAQENSSIDGQTSRDLAYIERK